MIIVIIGANAALAKAVMPVLAGDHTLITAGRKGCDINCDIAEAFSLPAGTDVVINFAAAFGGQSDEEIMQTEATNVRGTLNICVASRNAGVKHLIMISSIFALLDEGSPYYSIYALSKRQADELAQFYCGMNDMPLTILRPSQIYGDDHSFARHQPFFYQIIDNAQKGEDVTIYGRHDASKNYIHAADVAEIIRRVIERQVLGVYTCAQPVNETFSAIAKAAQKIFGKGGEITFLEDKPDTADNIFTEDSRLYEAVDYYPAISLETGLQRIKDRQEGAQK